MTFGKTPAPAVMLIKNPPGNLAKGRVRVAETGSNRGSIPAVTNLAIANVHAGRI